MCDFTLWNYSTSSTFTFYVGRNSQISKNNKRKENNFLAPNTLKTSRQNLTETLQQTNTELFIR